MCVSTGPSRFSQTLGYAGTHGVWHLLGYQNTFQGQGQGGNAMLLHIPALPGSVRGKDMFDTTTCPHILKEMATAVTAPPIQSRSLDLAPQAAGVEIREMGVYHIVIAADPRAIPAALEQVPAAKRPTLGADLFAFYHTQFPGWPVLCCCFDNARAAKAQPILLRYTPRDPQRLFIPGLDAHTGAPPQPGAPVDVDHTVIFATDTRPPVDYSKPPHKNRVGSGDGFQPILYSDTLPLAVRAVLPIEVIGGAVQGEMPNGDFVVDLADLTAMTPDSLAAVTLQRATPADWHAWGVA